MINFEGGAALAVKARMSWWKIGLVNCKLAITSLKYVAGSKMAYYTGEMSVDETLAYSVNGFFDPATGKGNWREVSPDSPRNS